MTETLKTLITIFLILFIGNTAFGQWVYSIDFDSPHSEDDHIIVDTISNPNNVWQIGVPGKIVFDSAYSVTHAIATDTINPYPVNDTSSFFLKHIRPGQLGGNDGLLLRFWFKVNTDTITDFGMIEASIDNGISWINLMTEDTTYYFHWDSPKPVLTGNSNGWQIFDLDLKNITYQIGYSDTILYRFTFISDSVQTNKDGWMLDDFYLIDSWEGVDDNKNKKSIKLFPNPSNGEITIENSDFNFSKYYIELYNTNGILINKRECVSSSMRLNLPNGVYYLKLFDEKSILVKKIVIEK